MNNIYVLFILFALCYCISDNKENVFLNKNIKVIISENSSGQDSSKFYIRKIPGMLTYCKNS